jgi:hypothetical protein
MAMRGVGTRADLTCDLPDVPGKVSDPMQSEVDTRGKWEYGLRRTEELGISVAASEENDMRKHTTILVLLLGIPATLGAQQQGSWSNLTRLKAGQGIEVIEFSMKHHSGKFIAAHDDLLTLKENGSEVSVKREDVARVSTSSASKRGEHAVIGLVAGAAIGAGIGAASGSNHGFLGGSSRGIAALVGLAIGGPSGAAVGAVLPAHTTIYRAPAPALSH